MSLSNVVLLLAKLGLALAALPADFQTRSAAEKSDLLWTKVQENAYPQDSFNKDIWADKLPSKLQSLQALWAPYLTKAFLNKGDEMEVGRVKILHSLGTIAKIQLKIFSNSTYTGIFSPDGAIGFARLSLAKYDYTNLMPGVALKILISGSQSQNFHLMQGLEGFGPGHNFFISNPTNVQPIPSSTVLKVVSKVFAAGVAMIGGGPMGTAKGPENENTLGLYEQASMKTDGSSVRSHGKDVVAPWKIQLFPNAVVKDLFGSRTDDFRTVLGEIPAGTVLYDVKVTKDAKTAADDKMDFIGQIVMQSKFVASEYGDLKMYFQHAAKRWQAA